MKFLTLSRRSRKFLGLLSAFGIVVLVVSIVTFPYFFHILLQKQMMLVEGSSTYDEWRKPKIPILTKFYLFNITNSKDVQRIGAKPRLQELGPYAFSESMERVHIQHHNNGTLSYKRKRFWRFEPDHSKGSLSDMVTTINMPLMAAVMNAKKMSFLVKFGLFSTIDAIGVQPFITHSVRELTFDGHDDVLLQMKGMMGGNSEIPMDKFGWFYRRNGTTWGDGVFNTFTGESDPLLLGQIHEHDHRQRTHYRGECGQIQGSAEGFYPLFEDLGGAPDTLDLFTHEACRVLTFRKNEENVMVSNLDAVRYVLDNNTFANSSVHHKNICYDNNLPSGVQNITHCKSQDGMTSPVFLSFPHFYTADRWYLDQFAAGSDINPRKEAHETRIVMQSQLSVPLHMAMRLQLIVKAIRVKELVALANMPEDLFIPCIWFEALLDQPEETNRLLRTIISLPFHVTIGLASALVVSVIFLILSTVAYIRSRVQNWAEVEVSAASQVIRPLVRPIMKPCNPGDEVQMVTVIPESTKLAREGRKT